MRKRQLSGTEPPRAVTSAAAVPRGHGACALYAARSRNPTSPRTPPTWAPPPTLTTQQCRRSVCMCGNATDMPASSSSVRTRPSRMTSSVVKGRALLGSRLPSLSLLCRTTSCIICTRELVLLLHTDLGRRKGGGKRVLGKGVGAGHLQLTCTPGKRGGRGRWEWGNN